MRGFQKGYTPAITPSGEIYFAGIIIALASACSLRCVYPRESKGDVLVIFKFHFKPFF